MDEDTGHTPPSVPDALPAPTFEDARRALRNCFGYEDFRLGQKSVIEAILAGRDVLAVMPTGAGKSLCYQIPSIILPGVAIVVSPLVSLMGDQVRALVQAGMHAAYLNSTLSPAAQGRVMERARAGEFDIVYVAPERLEDARFVDFASRARIALIAVDEAHCVSQWGQDFRPSYLQIGTFIAKLSARPAVCALTATATERVRDDIVRLLGLSDPYRIVTGFDRPNLHFAVERAEPKRKIARIAAYALEHASDSGIVYCSTRKDTEAVCNALVAAGVRATRYHAGLPAAERAANQQAFICDDAPVMVATNAFGMGIDKSNVRYVLHHNMPASIEAYYQEAGRAGRDGLPSECLLFWSEKDLSTCRFFIEQESANEELSLEEAEAVRQTRRRMLAAMEGYCVTCGCLREYLLRYFGEEGEADDPAKCGNCSNCEGGFERIDVTDEARAVMRCVQELRGEWGKGMVADVLRESATSVLGRPADMGLVNVGGIRNSLTQGPVTVANAFELLPFENSLCVLTVKGSVLKRLVEQIAARGGEGVSGIRMVIDEANKLKKVSIAGKPLDEEAHYTVATVDYLAEGNDGMSALIQADKRVCPEGLTLRSLFIEYVKRQTAAGKKIAAQVEGRVIHLGEVQE